LLSLSPELLALVAEHLGAAHLLGLVCVCRTCQLAAEDACVWRELLARRLAPMATAFFGGTLPPPAAGTSFKRHYFELSASWKKQAQEHTGRLLLQIGTQQSSGQKAHALKSAWDVSTSWRRPNQYDTFGVYDVTEFAHEHPGADLMLIEAIKAADATNIFESARHTDSALCRLSTVVVPGLEAVPYDRELNALRLHRQAQRRWLGPWTMRALLLFFGWVLPMAGLAGAAPACIEGCFEMLRAQFPVCAVVLLWLFWVGVVCALNHPSRWHV